MKGSFGLFGKEKLRANRALYVKTGVLSLYIFFITIAHVYLNITADHAVLLALGITVILSPLVFWGLKGLGRVEIERKAVQPGNRQYLVFLGFFLFVLAVEGIYYLGYKPGWFSNDSNKQLNQALSGVYNDWHPVWHTIVTFTLPMKITGKVGAIVLLQIIYFSFAVAYCGYVIYKHGGVVPAVVSVALIALNPYVSRVLLFPWKDVMFGIAGLTALTMAAEIFFEKGNKKPLFLILLGFVAANATLFRHNGILFTVPLLVAAIVWLPRRKWLYILLPFILTVVIIKWPVYQLIGVEQPGNRVTEISGLPLTVIGNVAKEDPEALDGETAEFIYAVAPKEKWEGMQTGNFNGVKWSGINTEVIEEAGFFKVLGMMFRCFGAAPRASLRGFFALTDLVYGIETGTKDVIVPTMALENVAYTGKPIIGVFLGEYYQFFDSTIFRYLKTYGVVLLAVLFITIGKIKTKRSWKKALFVLPVLLYDFGTMVLLMGTDSRFFWITYLVAPLSVVIMLRKDPA